jgi:hypothetical protein
VKALNQPESWWGWHGWNQPEPLAITQIIEAGTLSSRCAALLGLAIERGASIIFAADPPGAGKTTILTALLAFGRPDASLYFTRGWGETFRLPPPDETASTYMMINEISDHLPVYSWGPYVQRAFELMGDGYTLLSTMHAETVDGVIEQLVEECDVPPDQVGRLSFVVPMFVGANGGRRVRRVTEIAALSPHGSAYRATTVARWKRDADAFEVATSPEQLAALAANLGIERDVVADELDRRTAFIDGLLADGVHDMEDVQRRALAFQGYTLVE